MYDKFNIMMSISFDENLEKASNLCIILICLELKRDTLFVLEIIVENYPATARAVAVSCFPTYATLTAGAIYPASFSGLEKVILVLYK